MTSPVFQDGDLGPDIRRKLNEMGVAFDAAIAGVYSPQGWSAVLALVSDGERRVFEIVDWVGGEKEKPTNLGYVGSTGIVATAALALDVRGDQGAQGIQGMKGDQGAQGIQGMKGDQGIQGMKGDQGDQGAQGAQGIQGIQGMKGDQGGTGPVNTLTIGTVTSGAAAATITGTSPSQTLNLTIPKGDTGASGAVGNAGWTPVFANTVDGSRIVQQVIDWVGGEGSKPPTGNYVGASGLVTLITDGVNIRGASGSGSGDVTGSASSVTGNIAVFADGTGKALADGGRLGSAAYIDSPYFATAAQGAKADSAVQSSDLAPVATSGSYADLTGTPSVPAAQVQTDWNATSGLAQILNKPDLALVATSGSYADLTGTPSVPAAQVQTDWNAATGLGVILNKPAVIASGATQAEARAAIGAAAQGETISLVRQPINATPAASATGVVDGVTLSASPYYSLYSTPMAAAQWQVSTSSTFATTLVSTGDVAGTVVTYAIATGLMSVNTVYYWRVRYKDTAGAYSDWSVATSFTTAANFNDYIATPAPTPANYGDPFEGGFYMGLFWNQITQSTSSKTLATGTQVFTVPDMTAVPLVYAGQQLEVRSRANPANKFIGTVAGASGTSLTLTVSSIGGSGTFSDWSVMSKFRHIEAPKASGEHAGIAIKNANTALPTACQTLTEGWEATLAMVAAGDATTYPAAHWARNLVIGGKNDWHIPARDVRELSWRNGKPTTDANYVTANRPAASTFNYMNNGSYGDTANTHGLNNNSVPAGAAYTPSVPAQTTATAFRTGGAEAFEYGSAIYWSSSDYVAASAWNQHWYSSNPGYQDYYSKAVTGRVRAARRSII